MTWPEGDEGARQRTEIFGKIDRVSYVLLNMGKVYLDKNELAKEKCCYTYQVGRRNGQNEQFRGKILEVYAPVDYEKTLSNNSNGSKPHDTSKAPKAELVLRNISGEKQTLDCLLFGVPNFVEVFLPTVRHIE